MLKKRIINIFLAFFLVTSVFVPVAMAAPDEGETKENENIYSIFFTHDIHSHIDVTDNTGGLAAIAAKKKSVEKEEGYADSFLLDGGGFSMGTPFQTLFKDEAAELQLLDLVGYDATTLGNHEFDYGVRSLGKMINSADEALTARHEEERAEAEKVGVRKDKGLDDIDSRLAIVTANIDWKTSLAFEEGRSDFQYFKDALKQYGADDYVIIDKGGKKIAVFGLMGKDAAEQIHEDNIRWEDQIERAQKIVKEIERNKEADLTVCLSHSGGKEDEKLAKEVDDIDLIISAHTHERLDSPKTINDTYIVSAGAFSEYLGHIVLEKDKNDKFKLKKYELHRILSVSDSDEDIAKAVEGFKNDIDNKYFSKFGMSYEGTVAENPYHFTKAADLGIKQQEEPYANLIGDSYRLGSGVGADVAIVPKETIYSTIPTGEVTGADVFSCNPVGTGPDSNPGYPLALITLTGRELKSIAEMDASLSSKMGDNRLYVSGLRYNINPNRIFMNRVTDVEVLNSKTGRYEKIENKKLYRVVGCLYTMQMMVTAERKTYGLMSIVPKTTKGKPVTNFNTQIIYRKDNGEELKEWYVFAKYLQDQGTVPSRYEKPQGRKTVAASWNPVALFKEPNHVGVMLMALLLIPIVIIVAIIIYIRGRRQDRRGYSRRMFGDSLGKRNKASSRSKIGSRENRRRSEVRKKERLLRSESKRREK